MTTDPAPDFTGLQGDVRQLHPQAQPGAQPHPGPGRRQRRDHAQARRRGRRDPRDRPRHRHRRLPRHDASTAGRPTPGREIYPGILDSRHPRDRRPDLARRQLQRSPSRSSSGSTRCRGMLNDKGQYLFYGRVAGCLITGNEDGIKHCAQNVLYSLQHIGYTIPPNADAGWIGEAGPGPSYLDPGSGGPENDFTNRNTTFMTWNLMHLAAMLQATPAACPATATSARSGTPARASTGRTRSTAPDGPVIGEDGLPRCPWAGRRPAEHELPRHRVGDAGPGRGGLPGAPDAGGLPVRTVLAHDPVQASTPSARCSPASTPTSSRRTTTPTRPG